MCGRGVAVGNAFEAVKAVADEVCGVNEEDGLAFGTEQKLSFPYGNKYGWCVAHRKKQKLLCNVFAESGAFSVMMRLSDKQYASVYEQLQEYAG